MPARMTTARAVRCNNRTQQRLQHGLEQKEEISICYLNRSPLRRARRWWIECELAVAQADW